MSELQKHYIDNQHDFELACSRMKDSPMIALDTEFERRNTYYPILALLQVANDDESLLVDPLKIEDWNCFTELFASDTLFIMHSCSEDLEVFRKHLGALPSNLMDTQIACAFLGKGDAVGYANMVMMFRDIEIDKSETRSDWLQRPLTQAQQDYAREDVRWLLGIYVELEAELIERERLDWVSEECARMIRRYQQETQAAQQWLRIKGVSRINKDAWSLAYALADWRENLCRKVDKPRGWIMKDPELLDISQRRPQDKQELMRISDVTYATINRNSQEIIELTNNNNLPEPPTEPTPDLDLSQKAILKRCQKLVNNKAESLNLAARFIGNKQDLIALIAIYSPAADEPLDGTPFSSGWRNRLVGKELLAILG